VKAVLLTVIFLTMATIVQAQVIIHTPGVTVAPERPDYWRGEGEQQNQWRERQQFNQQAQRAPEWEHSHCVRDWQNHMLCRQ
jgi:hypothetical protein